MSDPIQFEVLELSPSTVDDKTRRAAPTMFKSGQPNPYDEIVSE
jgi:hypothetical protein